MMSISRGIWICILITLRAGQKSSAAQSTTTTDVSSSLSPDVAFSTTLMTSSNAMVTSSNLVIDYSSSINPTPSSLLTSSHEQTSGTVILKSASSQVDLNRLSTSLEHRSSSTTKMGSPASMTSYSASTEQLSTSFIPVETSSSQLISTATLSQTSTVSVIVSSSRTLSSSTIQISSDSAVKTVLPSMSVSSLVSSVRTSDSSAVSSVEQLTSTSVGQNLDFTVEISPSMITSLKQPIEPTTSITVVIVSSVIASASFHDSVKQTTADIQPTSVSSSLSLVSSDLVESLSTTQQEILSITSNSLSTKNMDSLQINTPISTKMVSAPLSSSESMVTTSDASLFSIQSDQSTVSGSSDSGLQTSTNSMHQPSVPSSSQVDLIQSSVTVFPVETNFIQFVSTRTSQWQTLSSEGVMTKSSLSSVTVQTSSVDMSAEVTDISVTPRSSNSFHSTVSVTVPVSLSSTSAGQTLPLTSDTMMISDINTASLANSGGSLLQPSISSSSVISDSLVSWLVSSSSNDMSSLKPPPAESTMQLSSEASKSPLTDIGTLSSKEVVSTSALETSSLSDFTVPQMTLSGSSFSYDSSELVFSVLSSIVQTSPLTQLTTAPSESSSFTLVTASSVTVQPSSSSASESLLESLSSLVVSIATSLAVTETPISNVTQQLSVSPSDILVDTISISPILPSSSVPPIIHPSLNESAISSDMPTSRSSELQTAEIQTESSMVASSQLLPSYLSSVSTLNTVLQSVVGTSVLPSVSAMTSAASSTSGTSTVQEKSLASELFVSTLSVPQTSEVISQSDLRTVSISTNLSPSDIVTVFPKSSLLSEFLRTSVSIETSEAFSLVSDSGVMPTEFLTSSSVSSDTMATESSVVGPLFSGSISMSPSTSFSSVSSISSNSLSQATSDLLTTGLLTSSISLVTVETSFVSSDFSFSFNETSDYSMTSSGITTELTPSRTTPFETFSSVASISKQSSLYVSSSTASSTADLTPVQTVTVPSSSLFLSSSGIQTPGSPSLGTQLSSVVSLEQTSVVSGTIFLTSVSQMVSSSSQQLSTAMSSDMTAIPTTSVSPVALDSSTLTVVTPSIEPSSASAVLTSTSSKSLETASSAEVESSVTLTSVSIATSVAVNSTSTLMLVTPSIEPSSVKTVLTSTSFVSLEPASSVVEPSVTMTSVAIETTDVSLVSVDSTVVTSSIQPSSVNTMLNATSSESVEPTTHVVEPSVTLTSVAIETTDVSSVSVDSTVVTSSIRPSSVNTMLNATSSESVELTTHVVEPSVTLTSVAIETTDVSSVSVDSTVVTSFIQPSSVNTMLNATSSESVEPTTHVVEPSISMTTAIFPSVSSTDSNSVVFSGLSNTMATNIMSTTVLPLSTASVGSTVASTMGNDSLSSATSATESVTVTTVVPSSVTDASATVLVNETMPSSMMETTSTATVSSISASNISKTVSMTSVSISVISMTTSTILVSDNETASIQPTSASMIVDLTTVSVSANVNMSSSVAMTTPSTPSTTTTTPPTTTTVNATTAGENYWVKTELRVQKSVNISSETFLNDIESRLAEAYNEAFLREKLQAEGQFDPLNKRRRRKRYTTVGDASIHVQKITREADTTSVSVAYTVERSGDIVTAADAVKALDMLDQQELAIILRHVVSSKAETYIQREIPQEPTGSDSQLWLIAAIVGPIVVVVFLIWVVLCVYFKCCRTKKPSTSEDGQPELVGMRKPAGKSEEPEFLAKKAPAGKELSHQGSRTSLRKGRVYEISPPPESDLIKEEQELNGTPVPAKRSRPPTAKSDMNGSVPKKSPSRSPQRHSPNKGKTSKKGTRKSSYDLTGRNDVVRKPSHPSDMSQLLQTSLSEDDEELRMRTETERRRNKERLRQKRKKERERMANNPVTEYLAARDAIDRVLDEPSTSNGRLPDVFIDSGSPQRDSKVPRQDSGVSNDLSGEETLEEARKRMHQLLDDAFTLISPRSSMSENEMGRSNKVSPMTSPKPSSRSSKSKLTEMLIDSKDTEKRHEPMYVNPGFTSSDFPLETWSPYRASDQVALISMPNKMETYLGPRSNTDKRPVSSKPSKRPAATFDFPESKSTGHIDQSKLTRSPPKPIVLKTKDLVDARDELDVPASSNTGRKYSLSGINGDIHLTGSTTSLSKHNGKGAPNGRAIEMQSFDNRRKSLPQKHKAPTINVQNSDEVDVVNQSPIMSDNLLKSLRDELQVLRGEYKIAPEDKKSKRRTAKSMTDII